LVYSGEVMQVINFTSSVQVSGVRCQQLNSTRWIGVDEMDFLSPELTFSRNTVRVQDSGFSFS
jgi:hypothetical protein